MLDNDTTDKQFAKRLVYRSMSIPNTRFSRCIHVMARCRSFEVFSSQVIKTAGSLKLAFGRGYRSRPAFKYVYRKLAYGWLSIQPNKLIV